MNRNMESFCDGYAKVIRLFPNQKEGIRTDWERIGRDIETSLRKYKKKELGIKLCQIEKKKMLQKKRKAKLSK